MSICIIHPMGETTIVRMSWRRQQARRGLTARRTVCWVLHSWLGATVTFHPFHSSEFHSLAATQWYIRVRSSGRKIIEIALSDLYPQGTINGTIFVDARQFQDLFDQRAWADSVGPSFRWNILNYGRIINNAHAQHARFHELAECRFEMKPMPAATSMA